MLAEAPEADKVIREPMVPREIDEEDRAPRGPRRVAALPRGKPTARPDVAEEPVFEEVTEVVAKPKPTVVAAKPTGALATLQQHLEPLLDKKMTQINPKYFVPTNRRKFKTFIIQSFWAYKLPKPPAIPDPDACQKAAEASKKEVKTFSYQAFVRDYIQRPSPYRGVLVYHGLGSGKTCTSIAAMEALSNAGQQPIYIMTPASLSKNYRDEITKCGPFLFRTNNHWTWVSVPTVTAATAELEFLRNTLKFPTPLLRKQKGAWVPDPTKPPNFESLSAKEREQIQAQIYAYIDARFRFINYNGLLEGTVRDWSCNTPNMFDGATIVIDEVHNMIRTMTNAKLEQMYREEPRGMAQFAPKYCQSGKKYKIMYLLYRMLVGAVGCKIIALSGTPLINYPHELGILANVLAGDTRMVEATLPGFEQRDAVLKHLERHPEVDFAEVIPRPEINGSTVRITPVPSGCRKVIDPATGALRGFVRDGRLVGESGEIARERDLVSWFGRVSEGTNLRDAKFSAVERLPDLEKPFRQAFIDTDRLEVKKEHRLALMARLSGLVSYYKGGKADLMARVTSDEVVMLDMSDRQLEEYTVMRKEEIDKELKDRKKRNPAGAPVAAQGPTLYDMVTKPQNSTFKIFSRAACNFAFPKDLARPRPADFNERDAQIALGLAEEDRQKKVIEDEEGEVEEVDEEPQVDVGGPRVSRYEAAIQSALRSLRTRASEIFSKEALPTYSPKFQAALDRIEVSRGPVLMYSQFKTLEGVGLFSMALEVQKGYVRLDIVQKGDGGGWTLSEAAKASGPDVPRYITYTGDEDAEKRNILKAIFNAAWSKMPASLAAEIKAIAGSENNQKGEVARVFMITQSGAEGISLSNVRQVHIMEPYWNYVRLEQVKGRAIRICSHMDLPIAERTVDVFTYITRFSDAQIKGGMVNETLQNFDKGQTTDQSILTISSAKKKLSDNLFAVMQESAVDCELNADENGALACFRFAGDATMEPLFHPLLSVHLLNAEGAMRAR